METGSQLDQSVALTILNSVYSNLVAAADQDSIPILSNLIFAVLSCIISVNGGVDCVQDGIWTAFEASVSWLVHIIFFASPFLCAILVSSFLFLSFSQSIYLSMYLFVNQSGFSSSSVVILRLFFSYIFMFRFFYD